MKIYIQITFISLSHPLGVLMMSFAKVPNLNASEKW